MSTTNTNPINSTALHARAQIEYKPHLEFHVSDQIRKHFDPAAMADLSANICEIGIQFPILARASQKKPGKLEIIAGERRWRANEMALARVNGDAAKRKLLEEVPVIVKALSDREALEIQLIENLQREQVTPREEAEGFARMQELKDEVGKPVYPTLDAIKERIGKSIQHISDRLKLRFVPEAAWTAMEAGKLTISHLELIGGVPHPKEREEYAAEVIKGNWNGVLSVAEAKDYREQNYRVSLRACGFDLKDEKLVPVKVEAGERLSGGACTDCPFRTGNDPSLKGQLAESLGGRRGGTQGIDPNICCNPGCFGLKQEAVWKNLQKTAAAEGKRLMDDKTAAGEFYAYSSSSLNHGSKFTLLDSVPGYQDTGKHANEDAKTWAELLHNVDLDKDIITARHPKTKKLFQLIEREKAVELASAHGHAKLFKDRPVAPRTPRATTKSSSSSGADSRKAELENKRRKMEQRLTLLAIAERLRKPADVKKPVADALVELAASVASFDDHMDLCLAHCGEPINEDKSRDVEEIIKMIMKKYQQDASSDPLAWVRWVSVMAVISESLMNGSAVSPFNKELVSALKIDPKKIAAEAKTAIELAEKRALEAEMKEIQEKKLSQKIANDKSARQALEKREAEICKELKIKPPAPPKFESRSESVKRNQAAVAGNEKANFALKGKIAKGAKGKGSKS